MAIRPIVFPYLKLRVVETTTGINAFRDLPDGVLTFTKILDAVPVYLRDTDEQEVKVNVPFQVDRYYKNHDVTAKSILNQVERAIHVMIDRDEGFKSQFGDLSLSTAFRNKKQAHTQLLELLDPQDSTRKPRTTIGFRKIGATQEFRNHLKMDLGRGCEFSTLNAEGDLSDSDFNTDLIRGYVNIFGRRDQFLIKHGSKEVKLKGMLTKEAILEGILMTAYRLYPFLEQHKLFKDLEVIDF